MRRSPPARKQRAPAREQIPLRQRDARHARGTSPATRERRDAHTSAAKRTRSLPGVLPDRQQHRPKTCIASPRFLRARVRWDGSAARSKDCPAVSTELNCHPDPAPSRGPARRRDRARRRHPPRDPNHRSDRLHRRSLTHPRERHQPQRRRPRPNPPRSQRTPATHPLSPPRSPTTQVSRRSCEDPDAMLARLSSGDYVQIVAMGCLASGGPPTVRARRRCCDLGAGSR
jgi:hypothetical protein